MTAHTQPKIEEELINLLQRYALSLGCTAYLTKPKEQREAVAALLAIIARENRLARIDEVRKAELTAQNTLNHGWAIYCANRLVKLTQDDSSIPTIPEDSIRRPLSDNPSPSKGLLKAVDDSSVGGGE